MEKPRVLRACVRGALTVCAAAAVSMIAAPLFASPDVTPTVRVSGHIPLAVYSAQPVAWTNPDENVTLAFILPFRNQPALDDLVRKLYDPRDPMYGQYLTNEQFVSQFGPSADDYAAVTAFARSHNLRIDHTASSRKLLMVSGAAKDVESAFDLRLVQYRGADGRVFRAPSSEPALPTSIASKITGISGLSTAAVWHSHAGQLLKHVITTSVGVGHQIGSGPSGGLSPRDIQTAYGLKAWPPADPTDTRGYGTGQSLALFELDVYTPSDILLYEQEFGLPQLVPTNVIVTPPTPTGGATEVTLDIELQLALAPLASAIYVYNAANNSPEVVQEYQQIADDNLAKQISTSWGTMELNNDAPTINGEYNAFQQMAAQGQSVYAASGDSGAYDGSSTLNGGNTTTLLVDDPASQPFMCGCGGTTLSVVSPGVDMHYLSEKTWADPSSGQGGGGGVSQIWPMPSYQNGAVHANSLGSFTMRNVPDVALNADVNTGYDIVFGGTDQLLIFGGTSCCSPLWSAFTARVNEARAANGFAPMGFPNPALYAAGMSSHYGRDFHDIADGSTNLYYPAVTGYDNATGWGSFIGDNLLKDLSAPVPTGLQAQPGNGYVQVVWDSMANAQSYNVYRSTGGGTPALIGSSASAGFTDRAVVNGTSYSYTVQAVYAGSSSFLTDPQSATPASVVITGGPFSATQAGGMANITWNTNVLSDSTVFYYVANSGKNPVILKQANSTRTLQHSITLSGLASLTSYHYYVVSYDGKVKAKSKTFTFKMP